MAKSTENLARVTRVGLDLAKNVFQVHGVDAETVSYTHLTLPTN